MLLHNCKGCAENGVLYLAVGGYNDFRSAAYEIKGVNKGEIYSALEVVPKCKYCEADLVSNSPNIELIGEMTNTQIQRTMSDLANLIYNLKELHDNQENNDYDDEPEDFELDEDLLDVDMCDEVVENDESDNTEDNEFDEDDEIDEEFDEDEDDEFDEDNDEDNEEDDDYEEPDNPDVEEEFDWDDPDDSDESDDEDDDEEDYYDWDSINEIIANSIEDDDYSLYDDESDLFEEDLSEGVFDMSASAILFSAYGDAIGLFQSIADYYSNCATHNMAMGKIVKINEESSESAKLYKLLREALEREGKLNSLDTNFYMDCVGYSIEVESDGEDEET